MVSELAFYGYGVAGLAFFVLFLILLTGWRGRFQGTQLLLAVGGSCAWALAAALQARFAVPGLDLVWAAEVVRNLLWIFFLLHVLKPFAEGSALYSRLLGYVRLACLTLGLVMLAMLVDVPAVIGQMRPAELQREFLLIGQLLFAVLGMALVEQLFRNTPTEQRWGIKYLCFGLGVMFAFDFYLYTDALLFHRVDAAIWSARGFVAVIAIPMIAVTAARNPDWSLPLSLSRRMVLHSTTLFSAGLYMLLMALAGYYIKTLRRRMGRCAADRLPVRCAYRLGDPLVLGSVQGTHQGLFKQAFLQLPLRLPGGMAACHRTVGRQASRDAASRAGHLGLGRDR